MSVVFFKNLGATNEFIGVVTNLLTIPWTVKPLWSALVDIYSTKRSWIIAAQLILSILIGALAATCLTPWILSAAVALFVIIAFASATHDIAIDGYYLDILGRNEQAFYVGIRNTAYKLAWLFGSGALVFLAGKLAETYGVAAGWATAFAVCAGILLALVAFHFLYLPQPDSVLTNRTESRLTFPVFIEVFASYFKQPGIVTIVIYILTFRAGDALMLSMAQPFLLDPASAGGMGISTASVGIIYGTIGTAALLFGGIVGGYLVSRDGLKRWLLPSALLQNSAILLYWLLAVIRPPLVWTAAVNALEQFSYGLGVAAYTVFLLSTVKLDFKAAHYAIATGMMALGLLLPGAVSGYLQTALGYPTFFLLSFLAALPGMITIFFLPLDGNDSSLNKDLSETG